MTQTKIDHDRKAASEEVAGRLMRGVTAWYLGHEGWSIGPGLESAIRTLAYYFAGHDAFELSEAGMAGGWVLGKGLLLTGPTGSSKTTLLEANQTVMLAERMQFTYQTIETADLHLRYIEGEKSKLSSGPEVIAQIGASTGTVSRPVKIYDRDINYNELGLYESTFTLYGQVVYLDRMIVDHFYGKPRKAGRLFHTSSNKNREQLREWLGNKSFSRLMELVNVIEVSTDTDLREISRPQRRDALTDRALERIVTEANAEADKKEKAQEKLMLAFLKDMEIYFAHDSYSPAAETVMYDILLERGILPARVDPEQDTLWRAEALTRAQERARAQRQERRHDRTEVARLSDVITQLQDGAARTTHASTLIEMEYKKIRLRAWVDGCGGYEGLVGRMTD